MSGIENAVHPRRSPQSPRNAPDPQTRKSSNGIFGGVLKQLKIDRLPEYVIKLRQNRKESHDTQPHILTPIFGSSHILYPIRFENSSRWILKIPLNGVESQWDALSAHNLRSEACTISLMKKETTIPLPEVIAYSIKVENEIGCPHILMAFIEGLPLDAVWFDKASSQTDAVNLEWIRSRVLRGVAKSMVQVDRYTSMYGASILFDEADFPAALGPVREIDKHAMSKKMAKSQPNFQPLYAQVGPFVDAEDSYTCMLDLHPPSSRICLGAARMIRLLVSWIPKHKGASFVMTHPKLDMENIIVSKNGDILGIIGWTGVHSVPRTIGNERYPAWLSKDWVSVECSKITASTGANEQTKSEHSREELAHYRDVYRQWIQYEKGGKESLRFEYDDDAEREDDEKNKTRFDATHMSLVSTNLYTAARDVLSLLPFLSTVCGDMSNLEDDPELYDNIISLLSKLLKELSKESGIDYGFYDLAGTLADNTGPCESHLVRLKRAFRALLKRSATGASPQNS